MHTIELGKRVRDTISGFEGIAASRLEYLNGCVQYGVRPKVGEDGKMGECHYIDVDNLEVIGDGVTVSKTTIGGPGARISGSYPA